uniref:DNA polymerase III, epsilon subunit-like protein n=1 Tax=Vibrio alginolyticus TaxID=663 RepID=A0A142ECH4_VIBAL|nr:DNA polymerase III, epsilon subunit-like protein [Vibrio alginolyticus]
MTRAPAPFPLERLADIPERPEDFRLLERIPLTRKPQSWPLELSAVVGDEQPMVVLYYLVKVLYSPSAKRIVSIVDVISLYEDPGKPIPELITELTGITDDMVQRQRIDDALVASWLSDDPLVVAHNAQFDRPFFEKRFVTLGHLSWACSASGIDWKALGFESRKLEYLLLRLGWFYEGHRAATDCLAMAWLFHLLPESVANLLSEADRRTVLGKVRISP